ncbi:zinc finger protein 593 homolog [Anopheles ziemanni]|uniref:zinc finger protein 593 homolog n=1 Tax=Anopheles coustani TaxID=139045 RepID=UPI00265B4CFD|nr:zinc finger protein 593 homolog [Anopheles coustani]XP_058171092.1 zinc finger protein 593 homolog [Anopheles ziemanni]
MPYRRKKMHDGNTHLRRRWRLRSRKKDLDEIDADLKKNPEQLLQQEIDLDKPGFAQFYCIHCATYYINDQAMQAHFRTKVHKRRLKALEIEPYTVEDSLRAAGHGSFVQPQKRKMETQPSLPEVEAGKRIKVDTVMEDEKPAKRELSKAKKYTDFKQVLEEL